MDYILAKLRIRTSENEKFRRVSSTNEMVYPEIEFIIQNAVDYNPNTVLSDNMCYQITGFSEKEFCNILIKNDNYTQNYDQLSTDEFSNIDYIFILRDNNLFFQNISKSKLVSKKGIFHVGEDFTFESQHKSLQINNFPDAVYDKSADTLYFRKLESITSIFKGISELYREATDEETEEFLNNDFIFLENNFSHNNVKTSNRKRIAIAIKTLNSFNDTEKNSIFSYIVDYCPDLKYDNGKFSVSNESELTQLLYGIEQRFYTTPIGNEKRLAHSIIKLNLNENNTDT